MQSHDDEDAEIRISRRQWMDPDQKEKVMGKEKIMGQVFLYNRKERVTTKEGVLNALTELYYICHSNEWFRMAEIISTAEDVAQQESERQ